MSASTDTARGGAGPMFLLFLLFLGLKLTGVIAWSWWLVTLPLWGPIALALVFGFLGTLVYAAARR